MKVTKVRLLVAVFALALGVQGVRAQPLGTPHRCAAVKMLAAGKLFQRFLACQARRAVDGGLSGDCFVHAVMRFRESFDKAESFGDCATPGDIDSVGALLKSTIDEMVFAQLQETCALLGNMNATTTCVQNPHVPDCPGLMGCVKEHIDRARSPFDFCACL